MDPKQKWTGWFTGSMVIFLWQIVNSFFHRNHSDMMWMLMVMLPFLATAACFSRLIYLHAFDDGKEKGLEEATAMAEETFEIDREMRLSSAARQRQVAVNATLASVDDEASGIDSGVATFSRTTPGLTGRLGELAMAVQARFWNPERGFDANDRDTFSSQDTIVEWIKENSKGISNAEAMAVEKVACPIKR